jgi:arabinofuranosyltransferase
MSFVKQFIVFFILIVIICFADYYYLGTGDIGIDDGNIFLNYAQHIAHGDGFVFNTNGERVEGFTSLLWVLVCAFSFLITAHPETLLMCLSCLLTAFTITIIYRTIKNDIEQLQLSFSKHFFWIYCAFIICIGPSYIAWSVLSLMENALWNCIFTLLVISIAKTAEPNSVSVSKKTAIILLGCLLTLTRPEALAWNVIFTCVLLFTFLQSKRKIYFPVIYFICFACLSVGLTFFRLHYFGYQFPNTYYSKISPDKIYNIVEGSKYALSFLTGYQPVISFFFVLMMIMLVYSIVKLKILKKSSNEILPSLSTIKKYCIVSLAILAGFVLPLTTGGDHFGGFRFYQNLLPLFAFGIVMIVWLFKNYKTYAPEIKKIAFSTVILFLLIISLNDLIDLKNPVKTQLNFEFLLARQGRDMADELNTAFAGNKPSVGVIAAGGFGLKYQGNTVDLMGLNNILMGHSAGDRTGIKNHAAFNKDVFYKLNPDILLPSNVANFKEAKTQYYNMLDENNFDNQAMKNIFNDEDFRKLYSPVFIVDKTNNRGIFVFAGMHFVELEKSNKNISIQKIL